MTFFIDRTGEADGAGRDGMLEIMLSLGQVKIF